MDLVGSSADNLGFPSGILDNESRKRSEPRSGSTRFTPSMDLVGSSLDNARDNALRALSKDEPPES